MKLYNTLSRKKERFTTPDGEVKMYVCGVTPYGAAHLGNAMPSIVFDVLRRYLEFKGYQVRHVQNFTDIDDKMIQAAAKTQVSTTELAEANAAAYLEEMDALNVLRAHMYPRATGDIPNIVVMIEGLIDKGFAYAVDGDVYFRVRSDDDYGKLSRRDLDSLKAGVRVEVDERKEDPLDFALWKSRKPGEPTWDSPWGPGRPGWHIECSAMSLAYLGETLDVHGGGRDLVFPHHENEIAQTESFTSKTPFVRFWMHNGTLQMNEDKMSKSLGNIITAREAIERFSSDAIRLFFLGSHYRSPLGYSDESVASQERAAERLCNALRPTERGTGKSVDPSAYRHQFIGAMDDDLNTPRAVAALFELAREINRGRERAHDVGAAQDTLKELSGVLGLTLEEPSERSADVAPFVQLLVDLRSELRGTRQFALADRVRDELASLGVSLEDGPEGTVWRLH